MLEAAPGSVKRAATAPGRHPQKNFQYPPFTGKRESGFQLRGLANP
jgi:hypothetical protein